MPRLTVRVSHHFIKGTETSEAQITGEGRNQTGKLPEMRQSMQNRDYSDQFLA